MFDPIKTLGKWKKGSQAFQKDLPTEWEMENILEYVEGLFTFAKFKVGDSVEMYKTFPVTQADAWGWMNVRHLLRQGSKAIVKEVDWYKGSFRYLVNFVEKTWIDDKDAIHPNSGKDPLLTLGEEWLSLSNTKPSQKGKKK